MCKNGPGSQIVPYISFEDVCSESVSKYNSFKITHKHVV